MKTFIIILSLFFFGSCKAGVYELSKLKGLNNLHVAEVYFHESPSDKFGLTAQTLIDLTELKLRQCGINVVEKPSFEDTAFVFIEVKSINETPTPVYLSLKICESATSDRTCSYTYDEVYSNWTMLLYGDAKKEGKKIKETISEWIDEFCNNYLKANPRSFVEKQTNQNT